MKAFWTFRPAILENGSWRPNIPLLPSVRIINPLDVNRLLSNPSAGVNHLHAIVGGMGLLSDQSGGGHEHFVVNINGSWTVRTRGTSEHTHLGVDTPDYFLFFVVCDDADYSTLTNAPYNVRVIVHATIQDGAVGELDNTIWETGDRTFWANASLSQLGITLPDEIDRGKRLILWLSGMLLSRRIVNDVVLR